MLRLGEAIITNIDTETTNPVNLVNAIWTPVVEDTLNTGPEKGYTFSLSTFHEIDVDSATITAFAQATSTTTTVTATHTFIAGDKVTIDGTTSYDGDYVVISVTGTTSFVITVTFVADDATGTANWTSNKYAYRFARPTCVKVTDISVGGLELTDWIRKGDYMLTNQEGTEVDMDYVLPVANLTVTNFPPHFIDVLWRKLAVHLAYALVQKAGFAPALLTELEQIYIPRAIGMDNRETYVQESSHSWQDAGHSKQSIE